MKKILIITAGFFPGKKYGGPPVSVNNFCTLMKDYNCYIIAKNHDNGDSIPYSGIKDGWNQRGNCQVKYLSDEEYNADSFEKAVLEIKPDVLYLQSLFQRCVFSCLSIAKKHNVRVILAPRGELCQGALAIKKYKKLPYIALLNILGLARGITFQSTSDEETQAIHKYLKIPFTNIFQLSNIPSIPERQYERAEKECGIGKFVFLSRIHPKKNLIGAIESFQGVTGQAIFDIYGPLEDKAYWEECQAEIKKLPKNITVNYCGLIDHDQVHETFSRYDAFLFPTFSENYGHVIAEALIVGCPVIISDQTPWNDVNEAGAGWAIPLKQPEAFTSAIQAIIDCTGNDRTKNVLEYIQTRLNLPNLRRAYEQMIDGEQR